MNLFVEEFKTFRLNFECASVSKFSIAFRNVLLSKLTDFGRRNLESGCDLKEIHFLFDIKISEKLR